MAFVSSAPSAELVTVSRPMVKALFAASCMLAVVSWYTTFQGMSLYLSGWFSILASLGIQTALVLVAWLIGFSRTRKGLLVAVYAITALVSIAFSYVSLYTWFSARERPASVERRLYDVLTRTSGQAEATLTSAIDEQQKHVLALGEMTGAERSVGHISRAEDSDPYLAGIRAAVAREGQTYSQDYREGSGEGVRYSAFDRYTQLARQSLQRLETARTGLTAFRAQAKPLDPTDTQLKSFHQVYDAIPWTDAEQALHGAHFEKPAVPAYADFVDRTVSGQEDLLVAFQELVSAPTPRHILALALAAFIDIIVFLLAWSSGPFFFGGPEQRWLLSAAAIDALDPQIFVRTFLRKLTPCARGMASVDAATLSPGEQQLCLLLSSRKLAVIGDQEGRQLYLLEPGIHELLMEARSHPNFPLRAAAAR